MPSLELDLLQNSIQSANRRLEDFPVFVETGTYEGDTSRMVAPLFLEVYTIEVDLNLYQRALRIFQDTNVTLIQGDSLTILQSLLPTIEKNTIFWLDGHYSGLGTGKGEQEFPLLKECSIIDNQFRGQEALILIDDVRLFGHRGADDDGTLAAVSVAGVLKSFTERKILNHWYADSNLAKEDRLILHIK